MDRTGREKESMADDSDGGKISAIISLKMNGLKKFN
jgi:hypothetical protein